jgi:hypothetical protein
MNISETISIKEKEYLTDKKIAFVIAVLYIVQVVNLTIKQAINLPQNLWQPISYVGFAIAAVTVISVINKVISRKIILLLLVEMLASAIYAISFLQNDISYVMNLAFWTIFICLPIGVFVASIKDKHTLYNIMLKASYLITFLVSIVFFVNFKQGVYSYNMSFSYLLLIPLLFHINESTKKNNKLFLILVIYEMTLILLYGSRGALVSIASFVIIKFIFDSKLNIKKIASISFTLISFILVTIFYNQIGRIILNYLSERGYYSRTLTSLFNGNILQDSGRNEIQDIAIQMIKEKPFLGWGVGGELSQIGTYPHSIVLEILLDFGVIIGTAIIMYLIFLTVKLFFIKDKTVRELGIIYLCGGLIPLFMSKTYLTSYEFFIFLFLVIPGKAHLRKYKFTETSNAEIDE